jgi:hypothetical protein
MKPASHRRTWRERAIVALLCATLTSFAAPASAATPGNDDNDQGRATETRIKHVIVLIGENRSFIPSQARTTFTPWTSVLTAISRSALILHNPASRRSTTT